MRLGDHRHDRVADHHHPVVREGAERRLEARLAVAGLATHARGQMAEPVGVEIGAGEHRQDARRGLCGRHVDAADAGGRMRRAHDDTAAPGRPAKRHRCNGRVRAGAAGPRSGGRDGRCRIRALCGPDLSRVPRPAGDGRCYRPCAGSQARPRQSSRSQAMAAMPERPFSRKPAGAVMPAVIQGRFNVQAAAHIRLRSLRPDARASHRRGRRRGRGSQLPGRRQSAQHFRPHGRRAGVRRLRILLLGICHPACRRISARSSAIPVFASRVFRHSFIFINRKFIKSPKDLEGKRIGVPVYTMTAAIFQRGLLSDEFGIDLTSAEWVEGDINSAKPHGNPTILPRSRTSPFRRTQRPLAERASGGGRTPGHDRHRRARMLRPQP